MPPPTRRTRRYPILTPQSPIRGESTFPQSSTNNHLQHTNSSSDIEQVDPPRSIATYISGDEEVEEILSTRRENILARMNSQAISQLQKRLISESEILHREIIARQVLNWQDGESTRDQLFNSNHPSNILLLQSREDMRRVCVESRNLNMQLSSAVQALTSHQTKWAPECPICMDEMFLGDACATRCGHVYHTACLIQALESMDQPKCSLCRVELSASEFVKLHNGLPEKPENDTNRDERETRRVISERVDDGSDEQNVKEKVDHVLQVVENVEQDVKMSNGCLKSFHQLQKYVSVVMDLRERMLGDYARAVKYLEDTWRRNVTHHDNVTEKIERYLDHVRDMSISLSEQRNALKIEREMVIKRNVRFEREQAELAAQQQIYDMERKKVDARRDMLNRKAEDICRKEERVKILYASMRGKMKEIERQRVEEIEEEILDTPSVPSMLNLQMEVEECVRNEMDKRRNEEVEIDSGPIGNVRKRSIGQLEQQSNKRPRSTNQTTTRAGTIPRANRSNRGLAAFRPRGRQVQQPAAGVGQRNR